jgi:predicted transcriptional regulator
VPYWPEDLKLASVPTFRPKAHWLHDRLSWEDADIDRLPENHDKKRSRYELHAVVLEAVFALGDASKSEIVRTIGSNRRRTTTYIDELVEFNFLSADGSRGYTVYRVSQRGFELLQLYRRIERAYRDPTSPLR